MPNDMPLHKEEIFKTGTHTDANGTTMTFDQAELQRRADMYNNQPEEERHYAPIVLGHPEEQEVKDAGEVNDAAAPAMGWVEKLGVEGDKLIAYIKDIPEKFRELVKDGAYKMKSAAFYGNGLLRHVAALGGQPPAVKGLEPMAFNDKGRSFTIYSDALNPIEKVIPIVDTQYIEDQNKRSYYFGIKPQKDMQNVKPTEYADLNDADFADPVHYKFPLTAKTIKGSLGSWSKKANKEVYSEKEQNIIEAKLINAAIGNKISMQGYDWAYSEVLNKFSKDGKHNAISSYANNSKKELKGVLIYEDGVSAPVLSVGADMLSKPQLLKVIANMTKPNILNKPFAEDKMDVKEMSEDLFNQFQTDLLAKVNEQFSAEIAAGVGSLMTALSADPKYWETETADQEKAEDATKPATAATNTATLSEPMQTQFAEMQKEIATLKIQKEIADNNIYFSEQKVLGKITPAQIPFIEDAFNAVHPVKEMQFSEKGKKGSGKDAIKRLINSFPKAVEFSELAKKGMQSETTPAGFDLPLQYNEKYMTIADEPEYFEAINLMAEAKSKGQELSLKDAYAKIGK